MTRRFYITGFLTFSALTIGACSSQTTLRDPATSVETRCPDQDPRNPYSDSVRFPEGTPNAGLCADTSIRRPLRDLLPEHKKTLGIGEITSTYSTDAFERAFANVYHDGQFWTARYRVGSVVAANFMIEHFAPLSAHSMIRFQFDPRNPLRLIPQAKIPPAGENWYWNKREEITLTDIVFSAEAVTVHGAGFNILRGFKDHFLIAKRFRSLPDVVHDQIEKQNHKVEQIRLARTNKAARDYSPRGVANQLFETAIANSKRDGISLVYNTLDESCVTEAFDVLDDTFRSSYDRNSQAVSPFTGRLPPFMKRALKARDFFGEELPDLNEEVASRR